MKGRTKRTALLLALAMVSASPAYAGKWKHLGSDGKSTHYFYNPKTYSLAKNTVASAWTKKEYNVDAGTMTQNKMFPDDYKGSRSVEAFEEFNCTEKKKRTLVGRYYEAKTDGDIDKTDWTAIAPGSIDEGLFSALCKGDMSKKEAGGTPAKK